MKLRLQQLFKSPLFYLFFILILASILRFSNLGYSEFQDDEKKAFMKIYQGGDISERLLAFRKGPAQFFVAYIPFLITHDLRNEFASRLPFSIANLFSIILFYLFVFDLSKNKWTALTASAFYSVNGFIVAFSRILQYQSLNLLFSLSSLLFFYKFSQKNSFKKTLLLGIAATLLTVLSFYSHWDALFYVIPASYFVYNFLKRVDLQKIQKIKIMAILIFIFCASTFPFFIPYISRQINSTNSQSYFNRRIGLQGASFEAHRYIFELYNPYYVLPFVLATATYFFVIFVYKLFKKTLNTTEIIAMIWFLFSFLFIKFFWVKPGTHIYNYLLPLFIISAVSVSHFISLFPKYFRIILATPIIILFAFYFYQSYMIFVDHNGEYPWDSKKILNFTTTKYTNPEVLTFGFPHFRNLKVINNIMSFDSDKCTYISNEGKNILQAYMDIEYGIKENTCYYILEVKRPFIAPSDGAKFAVSSNKIVYKYELNGESLVKMYKVMPKKPKIQVTAKP